MGQTNDLKTLINNSGYRISHLAEHMGLEAATLRAIIRGERKTTYARAKKLAQKLDVQVETLAELGLLQDEAV